MLGAAPTQWRRRAFLSFAAVVLTVVPLASARGEAARAPSTPVLPAHVWALYVDRAAAGELSSAALRPLRANELNTLIVDAGGMRLTAVQRVEELAKRAGLIVLVLNRPSAQAGAKPTQPRCRRWKSSPSVRCIAVAHTVPEARVLARKRAGALVLLKVTSQRTLSALRELSGAGHVIAVIDAGAGSQLRTQASWRLAVQTASAGDHLHLAFAPPASRLGATAGAYSTLVAAEVASSRTISDGAPAPAPAAPAPGSRAGSDGVSGRIRRRRRWRRRHGRYAGADGAHGPCPDRCDADEHLALLAGVDGRRRCDRLPALPRLGRDREHRCPQLLVLGAHVRHDLRARRRGLRRRRQRLHPLDRQRGDERLPEPSARGRHRGAVRAAGNGFHGQVAVVGDPGLAGGVGQRRCGGLPPVSEQRADRLDAAAVVRLHRAVVRDELHVRARGVRRGRKCVEPCRRSGRHEHRRM